MLLDSGYFFNPIKRDIAMIQGDTCSFAFELQGLQGQRPDSVIFTCKEKVEDEEALFMVSNIDTIDERSYDSSTDTLTYSVRIPPYLTHNVPLGRYFYDLQIALNSDVFTLMTGRLILEHQITVTTVAPPTIEVADDVLYPREDIIVGKIKGYTESYVNEIALKINSVLSAEGEYNISQMSEALQDVRELIDDINGAINTVLENDTTYTLAQMPTAITSFFTIFDSVIDNSIVNLKTRAESIAPYKFYGDDNLKTVELTNCNTIGNSAFYRAGVNDGLNTIKIDTSNVGSDEVFIFGESALGTATGASDETSASTLKNLIVDGARYIGMVSGSMESETSPIVEVEDPYFYESATTVTAEVGDLVVNSSTGEPYIYSGDYWRLYMPSKTATVLTSAFHSTKIRSLGFKVGVGSKDVLAFRHSKLLYLIFDKDFNTEINGTCYQMDDLRGVFYETTDGTLTEFLPFETIGVNSVSGSFADCKNLKRIILNQAKLVKSYAFSGSGLTSISLPALEQLGTATQGAFQNCKDLEKVTLGNGTKAFTFGSSSSTRHFVGCSSLYELTLNSTSYVNLTGSNQTMTYILGETPLVNFLGTTTTVITEGSNERIITINGSSVIAANGNIVTYGGKDWILIDLAWTEWGSNGNKHPVIKVPSDQIASYQANSKWSALSPEIWQAIS